MIEFKADCGHTVRAKDEEAGVVIRCDYCGIDVTVPDPQARDLDYLLDHVEQTEKMSEEEQRRTTGRSRSLFSRRGRSTGSTDPLSVVLRMAYVALLICVIVVVSMKWVLPLFEEDQETVQVAKPKVVPVTTTSPREEPPVEEHRPRRTGNGLLMRGTSTGLFIVSTPPGATAYYIQESKAPPDGRIADMGGSIRVTADGRRLTHVAMDTYMVEVELPWNDPRLSDPQLPHYQEYVSFRRALVDAAPGEQTRLLNNYFVPDEAVAVFLCETDDQKYIVRRYRGIEVRRERSSYVRALFLPRIRTGDSDQFAIAPLLAGYLPNVQQYGFNETHIRNELAFYEVPESDRAAAIEALGRIGVIPYAASNGRVRLFMIDVESGMFTTRLVANSAD